MIELQFFLAVIADCIWRFAVGKGNCVTPHGNDVAVVYSNLSGRGSARGYFLPKLAKQMEKDSSLDLRTIVERVAEEISEADENDGVQMNSTLLRPLKFEVFENKAKGKCDIM